MTMTTKTTQAKTKTTTPADAMPDTPQFQTHGPINDAVEIIGERRGWAIACGTLQGHLELIAEGKETIGEAIERLGVLASSL